MENGESQQKFARSWLTSDAWAVMFDVPMNVKAAEDEVLYQSVYDGRYLLTGRNFTDYTGVRDFEVW